MSDLALPAGVIILGLAFMQNPKMISNSNPVRDRRIAVEQKQLLLETSNEAMERASKIAIERINAGAIVVVSQADPSKFTTLSEDEPVLDGARLVPLPDGTFVASTEGNTGVIRGGVVVDVAWTGDPTARAKVRAQADAIAQNAGVK